jgi:hypothetical protein
VAGAHVVASSSRAVSVCGSYDVRLSKQDRVNLAIGLFSAFFVASLFFRANFFYGRTVSQVLAVMALVPMVAAFWFYMEIRGRQGLLGLLALIPVVGVVILLLLPRRSITCPTPQLVRASSDGPPSSRAA